MSRAFTRRGVLAAGAATAVATWIGQAGPAAAQVSASGARNAA
ncbi:hypothetical protein ABZ192_42160 [Streptomyces sp. NPDC006235]